MQRLRPFVLCLALACGDDDGDGGDGTSGATTTPGGTETTGASTSTSMSTGMSTSTSSATSASETSSASDTSSDAGSGSASTEPAESGETSTRGGPPDLVHIAWEHAQPCQSPQAREVTVTVTVEDPDTDPADLSFAGGIAGCDGEIDAAVSVLSCDGSSNHVGAVTITDPQGGSDDGAFTVIVCKDGEQDY